MSIRTLARASTGSASISSITAREYGAVGDGVTDDTAALTAALATALAAKQPLLIEPGTYKFTSLVIPANSNILASGAVFRNAGTLNDLAIPALDVGAGTIMDELTYSTPGTEIDKCAVWLGDGVRIERIELISDVQIAGTGCQTRGQDVQIGHARSTRFDNCYTVSSADMPDAPTTGFMLGGATIRSYRRGIFLNDIAKFSVGPLHLEDRSPHASKLPGNNGVLLAGVQHGSLGDCYIADAGEHAFRIGGSPSPLRPTMDLTVGVITAYRSGGCCFKNNPTILVSPGVTEVSHNVTVAGINGIDIGTTPGGNSEFLRITHARNMTIGYAYCDGREIDPSGQFGVLLNNVDGLWIGTLGIRSAAAGMIGSNGTTDTDGVNQFGGPVQNVHIGALTGFAAGNTAIGFSSAFPVSDIFIDNIDIVSSVNAMLAIAGPQVVAGPIRLSGRVAGPNVPVYDGPTDSNVLYDIHWGAVHIVGHPSSARYSSRMEIETPSFDPGNVAPVVPFFTAVNATSALNAYGSALSFSRVGSSRRGAAIAVKQFGASIAETGLSFLLGSLTVSQDAMHEALTIDHNSVASFKGPVATGVPATKTANFTWLAAESSVVVNNPSGVTTVTFIPAALVAGWEISITNYSAAFTVVSAASNVVPRTGGAAGTAILPATAGSWARLKSDGTNWIILSAG